MRLILDRERDGNRRKKRRARQPDPGGHAIAFLGLDLDLADLASVWKHPRDELVDQAIGDGNRRRDVGPVEIREAGLLLPLKKPRIAGCIHAKLAHERDADAADGRGAGGLRGGDARRLNT